jgi:hypothetical protein
MTKIVSATSEKTVIESRVALSEGHVGLLWFVGLAGPVLSWMVTNLGFLFVNLPTGEENLISLVAAVITAPVAVAGIHTFVVNEQVENYTTTSVGKWGRLKTMVAMLAPFGQKMKTGKKSVIISGRALSPSLIGGNRTKFNDYGYDDYDDYGYGRASKPKTASHEVETELVFKPLGVYIQQTLTPSATNIWDEAYNSTVAVHQFRNVAGVEKKVRHSDFADAPF